jgi:hypothetical protein
VCGLLSQMQMKLQYPTSQEARMLLDPSFLDTHGYVMANKSQSLLLGLDGRINLSASSGISHFVISVCRHVVIPSNFWKVPGKDLGFSAAARVPRLCSLLIQKVADVRREMKCRSESFALCDLNRSHCNSHHCTTT